MEKNSLIKKFLSVIGIIVSLSFFGLDGAVLFQMFKGDLSFDGETLAYIIILFLAGIVIIKISINALSNKEKKEASPKPIKAFIGALVFSICVIFVGVTSNIMLLTWAGFFLLIIFIAMAFSVSKDRKIIKNNSEEDAQEIFQKKNKHGGLVAILILIIAIILGFLLTGLVMEDVVIGDGPNAGVGDVRVCKFCDREFSDSSNTRSIARTGMCSNCSGNYKSMSQFIGQ